MLVRIDETRQSFRILRAASHDLPEGSHCAPTQRLPPGRCALSAVEGWRGEILHRGRTAYDNRLERCKIKDPSGINWAAIVEAFSGTTLSEMPLHTNGCDAS